MGKRTRKEERPGRSDGGREWPASPHRGDVPLWRDQLRCLYQLGETLRWEGDIPAIVNELAVLLPLGLSDSPRTAVRVTIGKVRASSVEDPVLETVLEQEIPSDNGPAGLIEVFRNLDLVPGADPFLPEERHFLWGVSRLVGEFLRRRSLAGRLTLMMEEAAGPFSECLLPLVRIDDRGRVVRVNRAGAGCLPRPPIALLGQPVADLFLPPSPPSPGLPEGLMDQVRMGRSFRLTLAGAGKPISLLAIPAFRETGNDGTVEHTLLLLPVDRLPPAL